MRSLSIVILGLLPFALWSMHGGASPAHADESDELLTELLAGVRLRHSEAADEGFSVAARSRLQNELFLLRPKDVESSPLVPRQQTPGDGSTTTPPTLPKERQQRSETSRTAEIANARIRSTSFRGHYRLTVQQRQSEVSIIGWVEYVEDQAEALSIVQRVFGTSAVRNEIAIMAGHAQSEVTAPMSGRIAITRRSRDSLTHGVPAGDRPAQRALQLFPLGPPPLAEKFDPE